VNDDRTVKVLFVDYGNIEECKASEMRKNVYMSNIPILCHKCQLDGIKPVSRKIYFSIISRLVMQTLKIVFLSYAYFSEIIITLYSSNSLSLI